MISEAEYLEQDRAPERLWGHEYWDGLVNERISCSLQHNLMVGALAMLFMSALRDTEWTPLITGMRVYVPAYRAFVYPDFMIVGPSPKFYDDLQDTLLNPCVMIEIASSETRESDRGRKAVAYQSLCSLTDYILVSEGESRVEHHQRSSEGWAVSVFSRGSLLSLAAIDTNISIDSIYNF